MAESTRLNGNQERKGEDMEHHQGHGGIVGLGIAGAGLWEHQSEGGYGSLDVRNTRARAHTEKVGEVEGERMMRKVSSSSTEGDLFPR